MNNMREDRYDEMKSLINKSKILFEQFDTRNRINIAKDIESSINKDRDYETYDDGEYSDDDEVTKKDRHQKYRISGGILAIHGKDKSDLKITTDDKVAFQETMDEFIEQVSDLVDFNVLNVYKNSVEWSGKLIDMGVEFVYMVGEESGVYLNGDIMKLDDEFLETLNKIKKYYQVFESKWSKILAVRKKTEDI
jgi:hypothetical protein